MSEDTSGSLKIQNIVASGSLADTMDLGIISTTFENCYLKKEQFPCAVYHITDPKTAILLFASGKVIVTGAKSHENLARAVEILVPKIQQAGLACYDSPEIRVTNIVCSYDTGTNINLVKMAMVLSLESVEYEPEVFPGLIYRIPDPRVVALIFSSGKLILTGGKNMDDMERGVEFLTRKLGSL